MDGAPPAVSTMMGTGCWGEQAIEQFGLGGQYGEPRPVERVRPSDDAVDREIPLLSRRVCNFLCYNLYPPSFYYGVPRTQRVWQVVGVWDSGQWRVSLPGSWSQCSPPGSRAPGPRLPRASQFWSSREQMAAGERWPPTNKQF